MREAGEASDGVDRSSQISTTCLPSTAPTIIDVKVICRALYTALSLRAMTVRSQHALTRTSAAAGCVRKGERLIRMSLCSVYYDISRVVP